MLCDSDGVVLSDYQFDVDMERRYTGKQTCGHIIDDMIAKKDCR